MVSALGVTMRLNTWRPGSAYEEAIPNGSYYQNRNDFAEISMASWLLSWLNQLLFPTIKAGRQGGILLWI